jgi:peptidoglycan/LPS O-acetylase OafA/YrhL
LESKKYLYISFLAAGLEITTRSIEIFHKINSSELSFASSIYMPILIFSGSCFLIFSAIRKNNFNTLDNKFLQNTIRTLGLSTYPFYLIHESIGTRVKFILINNYNISILLSALTGVIIALIFSVVIANRAEKILRVIFIKAFDGVQGQIRQAGT